MNEEIFRLLEREQLILSSKAKRAAAYMIDELILSVIWLGVIWDSFSGLSSLEEQINLINAYVLEFMALKVIYHTFFVMQYAASPGKMIMKISVIELSTMGAPTFGCALNRAFVRVISEMLFYIGFLWGLMDPARQTWHDKSAKTVIVDV